MSQINGKDYLSQAFSLAQAAQRQSIPYVLGGMSLAGMDCQGLCEYLLICCGMARKACNLAGSNAHFRACLWTGTPEECRQQFGCIPAGAWLFILKQDGGEPAGYKADGIGNASHMGVYLGEGSGALHASSSRGGVTVGTFDGTSGSGDWNRVGLCQWVDYGVTVAAGQQAADTEPLPNTADFSQTAQVCTPDGKPVKLRAKPSRKCSLYWKVPDGMTVQVKGLVEAQGITWVKTRYGSRKGYIMNAFITRG